MLVGDGVGDGDVDEASAHAGQETSEVMVYLWYLLSYLTYFVWVLRWSSCGGADEVDGSGLLANNQQAGHRGSRIEQKDDDNEVPIVAAEHLTSVSQFIPYLPYLKGRYVPRGPALRMRFSAAG